MELDNFQIADGMLICPHCGHEYYYKEQWHYAHCNNCGNWMRVKEIIAELKKEKEKEKLV